MVLHEDTKGRGGLDTSPFGALRLSTVSIPRVSMNSRETARTAQEMQEVQEIQECLAGEGWRRSTGKIETAKTQGEARDASGSIGRSAASPLTATAALRFAP